MTVSPIAPMPAPPSAGADTPSSGVDAEFAALVDQNLGTEANGAAPGSKAGAKAGTPSGSKAGHAGASLGGAPDGAADPAGNDAGATAVLVAVLAGSPVTAASGVATTSTSGAVAPTQQTTPDAGLAAAAVDGAGAATVVQDGTSDPATTQPAVATSLAPDATTGPVAGAAVATAVASDDAPQASTPKPTETNRAGAAPVTVAQPGTTSGPAGSDLTGDGSTDPGSRSSKAPGSVTPTGPTSSPATGSASTADLGLQVGSATATAPASATTTPATAPASATSHSPVAHQVFGEVSQLVSRGDGTHRITIKLQPEALGDVRIVLSVKDGAVNVSLAAERHAHHALIEGAPELRRLLQSVGAQSTDIVVKDLPSATSSRSDLLGQHAAQQGATGREQSPEQTAGKQSGETSARDGGTTGEAAVQQPSPIDPGTRTRSGVDVTM